MWTCLEISILAYDVVLSWIYIVLNCDNTQKMLSLCVEYIVTGNIGFCLLSFWNITNAMHQNFKNRYIWWLFQNQIWWIYLIYLLVVFVPFKNFAYVKSLYICFTIDHNYIYVFHIFFFNGCQYIQGDIWQVLNSRSKQVQKYLTQAVIMQ